MTMRERILAVLQGKEHDRVPFVQYDGLCAPTEELWALLGRENVGALRWTAGHILETPNCGWEAEETVKNGLRTQIATLHTPEGDMVKESQFDPVLNSPATRAHLVKEPEDYKKMIAYLRDAEVVPMFDYITQVDNELGDNGLPHTWMGRTPYQAMWVEWVSLEDLCIHMVDCPDLVDEAMSLLGEQTRKIIHAIKDAPLHYVIFGDNITAPCIGERFFREYCLPYYQEAADVFAERDIPVIVHMDGDLKPLWGAIKESRLGGLESFSPPPDNDTTVADAMSLWPDFRIWVNFPSSIHLASPEVIYEKAMEILEQGGRRGKLQIQISENVPPDVWRKSLPPIAKAIEDFGKPC